MPFEDPDQEVTAETEKVYKCRENIEFALGSVKARTQELMTDDRAGYVPEDERMDYLTVGRCKTNSAHVIDTLTRFYPDNFSSMFIVSGVSPTKFKDAPYQIGHSYFVLEGKDHKCYAGSPANTQGSDMQNFEQLLESNSLEDIITKINGRSGGQWPTSEEIKAGLLETPAEVKIDGTSSSPKVEFTNISYSYPAPTSGREGYDFKDFKDPDFINLSPNPDAE